MSKLLRLPFALLAMLALFLLTPSIATAGDSDSPTVLQCTQEPETEGCGTAQGDGVTEPNGEVTSPLLEEAPLPVALPPVPCDRLPGVGLPNCAPPLCDFLPTDAEFPDCLPAPPPKCEDLPGSPGGLDLCQFPDSDCPPPAPAGAASAAAVTDGECTPPISCDQFAQLFGFGDSCDDIPLCIPRDQVPPGGPFPIPSPPFCPAGGGGTPSQNPPPTNKPPTQTTDTPSQPQGVYYANCDDARAHGATNISRGAPGYRPELDSDSDGIACEEATQVAVSHAQPSGKLAYTGVEVEGLIRLAAILVSGGTLVLLAGVRRA